MKRLLIALVIAAAAGGGALVYWINRAPERPFNVLIVSACSVRTDRLGLYNPEFKHSPKIDDWAKAHNPMFEGPNADMLSMIPFVALSVLLYFVAVKVEKPAAPSRG